MIPVKKIPPILFVAGLLISLPSQAVDVRPTIIIYTGADTGFAQMLADLIDQDERIDSETRILTTPDMITLAISLPQTECVVVYSGSKAEISGLEGSLASFLEAGGGLVGMREVCYEPSAGEMATEIFPVFGNGSAKQLNPKEKRVRTYVKDEASDIADGLPGEFEILSMGTYFSADAQGNYLEVPGDYQVPYRDGETGSPLVVTMENEKGGRSAALPGVWTAPTSRLDIYYGNVVADDDFVRLFTNTVHWAAKGSTRFREVEKNLAEKLEEARTRDDQLREEAERARRKESTQRMIILAGVWIAGLLACGLVIKKLILVPIEIE